MASSCPHCNTPLIGSSCYICGWSPTSSHETSDEPFRTSGDGLVSSQSSSSARRDDDDFFGGDAALPAETIDNDIWGLSAPPPQQFFGSGDSPLGRAIESSFSEPQMLPLPSEGARDGSFDHVLRKALVGEVLSGTLVHVSDVSYDTTSLAAFNSSQQLATGCIMAPFKAVALLLGILFAPLRFLLGMGLAARGGDSGPDSIQIPVHRFRLEERQTGQLVECVLKGQLTGGALYLGEEVEVSGKRDLSTGTFTVQRLVSLSTGAITTGDVDARARFQKVRLALALALVLFAIYALWSMIS